MRRNTARRLKPHLPALRRYIRSVTGSRHSETLMAQTAAVAQSGTAEIDRHGLMLRHAQVFSVQDVAVILRCDVLDLTDRLESAYSGMHRPTGSDVLLIEEDPVLANGMTETIESMGHRVLGVARNRSEAEAAAGMVRLDAVVADFHRRPDGRSDAKIDRLLDGIDAPIVLVMAGIDDADDKHGAPPYAIATPFQPAELKVLLTQALQNRRNGTHAA